MNRQIVQLFGLFAVLFALLVVFTSRWTVFEAQSLEDNAANRRPLIEEQRIPRGLIFASDGHTRLALNRGSGRGKNRIFTRVYPRVSCSPTRSATRSSATASAASSSRATTTWPGEEDEFESIFAGLEGRDREGLDVVTNLDVQGTAGGDRRPGGPARGGGGDRAADRQGARDGVRSRPTTRT